MCRLGWWWWSCASGVSPRSVCPSCLSVFFLLSAAAAAAAASRRLPSLHGQCSGTVAGPARSGLTNTKRRERCMVCCVWSFFPPSQSIKSFPSLRGPSNDRAPNDWRRFYFPRPRLAVFWRRRPRSCGRQPWERPPALAMSSRLGCDWWPPAFSGRAGSSWFVPVLPC